MTQQQWYMAIGGHQVGPVSQDDVVTNLRNGTIDGNTLVFTAGIGENSPEIRQRICEASAWLGVALDTQLNAGKGPRISTPQSKVSVWVIPTNEELMIHRHTATLLQLH